MTGHGFFATFFNPSSLRQAAGLAGPPTGAQSAERLDDRLKPSLRLYDIKNVEFLGMHKLVGFMPAQDNVFDLLVIGGGIVGAGVARDAALRGLRTCLVEQADFASGTSSRSSRLLHGGIRYLAQAQLKLVREASREKMILSQIAPHLASPLAFVFPTRRGTPWAKWKLAIGVKLYDLLCGGKNLGSSQVWSSQQTLEKLPGINPEGLTGAVRFFDGFTNDARLTLDTLRSAKLAGATLHNYTAFHNAEYEKGLWQCELTSLSRGETESVSAKCVVNATGPWSNRIPHSQAVLRLTKGVHLVIDRQRLPLSDAAVLTEGDRILFAIPWGERVILGTTDTDFEGDPNHLACDHSDLQYILDVVNASFPQVCLKESEVTSNWVGLRPLLANPNGKPSEISRRHDIRSFYPGWWDVTGGKLTTYRLMAEETVDRLVRFLGLDCPASPTGRQLLLPAKEVAGVSGILPPAVTQEVVEHYCHNEWAVHLDDIMTRRTGWRYYLSHHEHTANLVSNWMRTALNWSHDRMLAELLHYRGLIAGGTAPPPNLLPHSPSIESLRAGDS